MQIVTSLLAPKHNGMVLGASISAKITIRAATTNEQTRAAPWLQVNNLGADALDVVEFSDGQMQHAPETIAAYQKAMKNMPAETVLIYVHRGVQVDCVHPLLASLLFLTGHKGKSHAVRNRGNISPSYIETFARAVTPRGGAAIVIDDRQRRIGARGTIKHAPVFIHFFNPACAI